MILMLFVLCVHVIKKYYDRMLRSKCVRKAAFKPVFSKKGGSKGGEVAAHLRSTETWAVEQLLVRFKA